MKLVYCDNAFFSYKSMAVFFAKKCQNNRVLTMLTIQSYSQLNPISNCFLLVDIQPPQSALVKCVCVEPVFLALWLLGHFLYTRDQALCIPSRKCYDNMPVSDFTRIPSKLLGERL